MPRAHIAFVSLLCLVGCSDNEHVEHTFASHPQGASFYRATLIQTSDSFALGSTNSYQVRIDAAPRNDDGWFFRKDLDTDLGITPKPELRWVSANDLIVTVHTAQIDGQMRRRFGGDGRPIGSLTIRYLADQREQ